MHFSLLGLTCFWFVTLVIGGPLKFGKTEAVSVVHDPSVSWALGNIENDVFVYLSKDGKTTKYSIDSVSVFFDIVNKIQQGTNYSIQNKKLYISFSQTLYDSTIIYDIKSRYLQLEKEKLVCRFSGLFTKNPLSLLGTIFSFESLDDGIEACGTGGFNHSITSIDLVTGGKVNLPDLVDSQSLVVALKSDPWVRKKKSDESQDEYKRYIRSIETTSNLNSLYDLIAERKSLWNGDYEHFDSFAFVSFDIIEQLVGVRLLFYERINSNSSKKIQLGLMLKPVKSFLKVLLKNYDVGKKDSFFIDAYKNTLR